MNTSNSKEQNIITVDLTNDEKFVFSQLGINPLIKLGKEYLTINNIVRLKENTNERQKTLENKNATTKQVKEISKSKKAEVIEINIEDNANSIDKSIKKSNENEEVILLDKKDKIEEIDDVNNARKKRRRSSANIE